MFFADSLNRSTNVRIRYIASGSDDDQNYAVFWDMTPCSLIITDVSGEPAAFIFIYFTVQMKAAGYPMNIGRY